MPMKKPLAILSSFLLLAACQGGVPTRGKVTPKASPRPAGSLAPGELAPSGGALPGGLRPVGPGAVVAELTGKVKLLSNNGAGVISNNGGGVISNNGAGLISDGGGGLIAKTRYVLAQAAPAEALLADAVVEVLDARGQILAGADGKPLGATTDRTGSYVLKGALPDENLVLRIKLWQGGELSAILPRGQRQADLDTASTLGAAYVLATYVKSDPAVLDRLPAREAGELRAELEAARGRLPGVPDYRAEAMVAATATLRAEAPAVDSALKRIEALLLLGQAGLGTGRQATEVAINAPYAIHRDAAGNVYVGEQLGRIRRIAPDGTIHLYAGLGGKPETGVTDVAELYHMTGLPDGTLFYLEVAGHRIRKLTPAGVVTTVAGGGTNKAGGGPAAELQVRGRCQFALGPDGSLYLADDEEDPDDPEPSRLLRIRPDGQAEPIAFPDVAAVDFNGVAVDPDGVLYLVASPDGSSVSDHALAPSGDIWRLAPGGSWTKFYSFGVQRGKMPLMAPKPGVVYFAGLNEGIYETRGDGTAKRLVQLGHHGAWGLFAGPDGSLVYGVTASHTVFKADPAGQITHLGGLLEHGAAALAQGLSINSPLGLAYDAQGRLLIVEAGARLVRRLDGDRLVTVVGEGSDADAIAPGYFDSPGTIAAHGDQVYVLEMRRTYLERIGPEKQHLQAMGFRNFTDDEGGTAEGRLVPAKEYDFARPIGLAVDPQGRPLVADAGLNVIVRLNADGQAEVIAGATTGGAASRAGDAGDGGLAADARLNAPNGLAFDSKGNLYVADSLNCRIRRITPDGKIDTFAGLPFGEVFARLGEQGPDTRATTAKEAALVAPFALCFDQADNLYVAELGTTLGHKLGTTGALLDGLPKVAAGIRKITPDGRVTLVAGRGAAVLSGEDGGDALVSPAAMIVDPEGNLLVADSGLNQVRLVPKAAL